MDTIELDPVQAQSYEALVAFLQACRGKAIERGRPQLVSIAAHADSLDPLAVLESIYEDRQLHFYLERRHDDLAIAGAEEALRFTPSGAGRFQLVKEWIDSVLEDTIAVGDPSLPFFGPHFFTSFAFFEDEVDGAPFASASVFVPRWQVAVERGRCVAIANALVEADSEVEEVASRIWNANTKFRSFDYTHAEEGKREKLTIVSKRECGGDSVFVDSVRSALTAIREERFRKIVLARALDLEANQAFHPLEILNTLRESYADCYAFSIANGKGQSFIGASPECLVSAKKGRIRVDVLAGTAPRGSSASEDASLGNALLQSEKDVREHAIVYESIRRRLEELGVRVEDACRPTLQKLQNVQHLHVEIQAELPEGVHLLDIVAALHPTPAVGGTPREAAISRIRDFEPFDRGLYAAPIGWVDPKGDGAFIVAIRSALVSGSQARLYAGVGIVDGSDPEREHQETNLKFRALLENLL